MLIPCAAGCGAQVAHKCGRRPRCSTCRKKVNAQRAREDRKTRDRSATYVPKTRDEKLVWDRAVDAACSGVTVDDLEDRFGSGLARRAHAEAKRLGALNPVPGYMGLRSLPAGLPA